MNLGDALDAGELLKLGDGRDADDLKERIRAEEEIGVNKKASA
jgi:hypothetical protein